MRKLAHGALGTAATAALLVAGAGAASAHHAHGASAEGVAAGSPGVVSGNEVQVPLHVPVNLCGNSIDVIGALNPAFGNHCTSA
ncbi:chaplin [Kitasatospora sp. CM 4170]|uniref:Chaplin n=1 Tax=Kitasatospora aburaviensis TaxID=67265 RepID=A0ABW1EWV7_9ACTN|nr:chaplin [Kitasatospora sp. CM 4170]WNM46390.1 chaplin [Kitasatospora sp. CM 4170]